MPAITLSAVDVVNLGLVRIGYADRIGSMFEGSKAAKAALDIYSQTRDALLREGDYGFAERNVAMTLLKQAPVGGYFPPNVWNGTVNPPPPWTYEYTYPADCLKVRSVKPIPLFVQNFDPQPNVFAVENDAFFNPNQKVILCNVPNAMLVYTGQVTNPDVWENDFVEEFADALAKRLSPLLASADMAKLSAAEEMAAKATADATEG